MPQHTTTCCSYILVVAVLLCLVTVARSCYLSTQAKAGDHICSFVLSGYDIELSEPSDEFTMRDGSLFLAKDYFNPEELKTLDLGLLVSNKGCKWVMGITLSIVKPELARGPQRYSLWPRCTGDSHGYTEMDPKADLPRSRTRRDVTVCNGTIECDLEWTMVPAYPYIAVVPRDAPNDACIYTLSASTQEPGSKISYHLRSASENAVGRFRVDESSGCVFTVVTANEVYNDEGFYLLSVYASSDDELINAEVSVFVDYHVPQFTEQVYEFSVIENTDNPIVGTVEALSFNIKWAVTYSILEQSHSHMIDAVDGTIRLQGTLDRESDVPYFLIVGATDQNGTGQARVNVAIGDVNDCDPTFEKSAYFIYDVPETTTGVIETFVAADCDEGQNAEITYSTDSSDFTINNDGELSPVGDVLDYDVEPTSYVLQIRAVDAGNPQREGQAMVIIQVADENDEAPSFVPTTYSYIIDENIGSNQLDIGAVYATDADEGATLDFEVNQACFFDIDDERGVISFDGSNGLQDVEVCTITVSDGEHQTEASRFTVTVNDINDNQPVFINCPSSSIHVNESASDGTFVAQVTATDADKGLNGDVTYSIEPSDTPFGIDSRTGEITVTRSNNLDRESTASYQLTVIARDLSPRVPQLQGFCDMTVDIDDANDEYPEFQLQAQDYTTLTRRGCMGCFVVEVVAEDPDLNTTITYYMEDNQYFAIAPDTGRVQQKPGSDETPQSGSYRVVASDGLQSTSIDITINVGDDPTDAPDWSTITFSPSGPYNIDESTLVSTIVVTLSISGNQEDVIFQLLRGARPETNSLNSFDLENNDDFNGATISVGQGGLDYETVQSVTLQISARFASGDSLRSQVTLVLDIVDVNDNQPTFLLDIYEGAIEEGLEASEANPVYVMTVTASDLDVDPSFQMVSYDIVGGDGAFVIDSGSGNISAVQMFDREVDPDVYTLNVKATQLLDEGEYEVTTAVSIHILDTNDFQPSFDASNPTAISVREDRLVGDTIASLRATDPDAESILQYSIIDVRDSNNNNIVVDTFTVDSATGNIALTKQLDYEYITGYELTVSVNDGLNSETATITVNVVNVEDEAPQFDEDYGEADIDENFYDAEDVLYTVEATDDCEGTGCSISYAIEAGDNLFEINEAGDIKALGPLDREETDTHYLVVSATNQAGLQSLTEVVITVVDLNDNPPEFSEAEYIRYVPENYDGLIDDPVTAGDPDTDFALTYEISDTANFRIDSDGYITVLKTNGFDREETDSVQLQVCAEDTDNIEYDVDDSRVCVTVMIVITDVNDNLPSDLKEIENFGFPETAAIGETVVVLGVSDDDVDFRNQVEFEITSIDNIYFDIETDPYTLQGIVTVKQRINCDGASSPCPGPITFTVEVIDNGYTNSPAPTLSLAVSVIAIEVDEAPVIEVDEADESGYFEIEENISVIGSVYAYDEDDNIISLSIDPASNRDGEFSLRDSGSCPVELQYADCLSRQLVMTPQSDRERVAEYSLVITVESEGNDRVSKTFTIVVNDEDDEAPDFSDSYSGVIIPSVEGQQWIATVSATDDDTAPTTFEYTLSNFLALFELVPNANNNTATIYTRSDATFTTDNIQYDLALTITDDAGNVGSETVKAIVYSNVNPHGPGELKTINVYAFEGSIPVTVIGTVPYTDEDAVDDKTFASAEALPSYFFLNDQTGTITIQENTPAGTYNLKFKVMDDRYGDSIITWSAGETSDVTVIVKSITRAQAESSGSVKCASVDPLTFVNLHYSNFLVTLSGILGVGQGSIDVYSVLSDGDGGTNVRYTVSDGSGGTSRKKRATSNGLWSAESLDAAFLVALGDGSLDDLGLDVTMVSIDACIPNPCYSECSSVLTVDPQPVTTNGDAASLVSVNAYEEAECSCAVRASPIGGCLSNTCKNRGTCNSLINGDVGYTCECLPGFDGPECQQLVRTFNGGYAWFEALTECEVSHTSLQVLTSSASGILLYSGHLDTSDASQDFMLLELRDGLPELTLRLSNEEGGQIVLSLTSAVDDGEWHQIDIYRNDTYVEMVLDSCAAVDYTEDHSESTLEADDASCRTSVTMDLFDSRLDSNRPLQLGGVQGGWDYDPAVPTSNTFAGCIRNLIQDGNLYDLAATDTFQGSEAGCAQMTAECLQGDLACVNGTCDIITSQCICDPGWTGATCDERLTQYDFAEDSYVTYELSEAPNPKISDYYVMIRTRQESGLIWTIRNGNTYEHITLELVSGYLQASWHLGDTTVIDSLPFYPLDNGEWHAISFKRVNNYITIKIDGGGSVRELSNYQSTFGELNVDFTSLQVGARLVREVVILKNMLGCAADIRLDNRYLGILTGSEVLDSQGVTEGCSSNACANDPCANSTAGECVDLWRDYECRPIEPVPQIDAILVLSTGAIIAIVSCLLFLIIMLLIACCWARQLDKHYEKMLLMVDEEIIEEDLTRFDEEGGGEEDESVYDPTPFVRKPLVTERQPMREVERRPVEEAVRPVEEATVEAQSVKPVKTGITFHPSVRDYLHDRKHDEDNRSDNGAPDDLHEYQDEGGQSSAGSLSSLDSSTTDGSQDFGFLQEYGPPFKRLADMYGTDDDPSVRLSYSSTEA